MDLPVYLSVLVLALAAVAVATASYHRVKSAEFFIVTLFGYAYTFQNPLQKNSSGIAAPYIRPINEFLKDFADATETTIEFTSDDIKENSIKQPLLRALEGMDYEKIRLRLRIISSLNPTINLSLEEGIIHFTCGSLSGATREFKVRSEFASKGQSILLEKLRPH